MIHHCLDCGEPLRGRADKKFCDDHCRNSWHNRKDPHLTRLYRHIHESLRKNRRILETLRDVSEQGMITRGDLSSNGFNFNFHTSQVQTVKGEWYHCCYDYGYRVAEDESVYIVHQPLTLV